MFDPIKERRSIRNYKKTPVPKTMIETILQSGILAPSSKNRQPWRFTVVSGKAKKEVLSAMQKGLNREKQNPILPDSARYLSGAEHTLCIMEQAPVLIFITNALGTDPRRNLNAEEHIYEICNAQSIGAAVENMCLTAVQLGLGSLWICDTFFAYPELCGWLDVKGSLAAALAVGYADESPQARPRLSLESITEWKE